MTDEQIAWLTELASDAESCGRLSNWEESFMDGMRARLLQSPETYELSARQLETLESIESRVYAT
jgi:hypothetical protein